MFAVVRSYNDGTNSNLGGLTKLSQAFNDGWRFFRASEYVPPEFNQYGNFMRYGYIEYILFKDDDMESEAL